MRFERQRYALFSTPLRHYLTPTKGGTDLGDSENKTEVVLFTWQIYIHLVLVRINLDDVLADEHEDTLAAAQCGALREFEN